MRNARLFGILFLFIGIPISILYLSTLNEIGATLRIFMIGPIITGASIGMIILPGYTLTKEEWSVKQQRLKLIFSKTKLGIKIFWAALGFLGAILVEAGVFDTFFTM